MSSDSLKNALKQELQRVMLAKRMSVARAAEQLEVSRQTMNSYVRGKSFPRPAHMSRMIELWGINVQIGDTRLGLPTSSRRPQPLTALQTSFVWDALDSIKTEDLRVKVKRVGKELRLSVNIGIPA
jgi:transcriptional regulator with XRE-family HTH domain